MRLSTLLSGAIVAVSTLLVTSGCSGPQGLTLEQRVELLPVENAQWRRIGYRWGFTVAPPLAADQTPVRTVVSQDLLLTQNSIGEITAFSTESGSRMASGVR
jgi:hypothetical protein